MTKADKLRSWALAQVGSPYVMGGTGQPCTPSYRKARAEQYPNSAAAIRRNCPVMSGKQSSCGGCKYDGKRCYDCAQLVRRGCAAAEIEGVNISGATSQWNKGDWLRKGSIQDMPAGQVCILYREDKPGIMGHTGIALGDGTVVHASGHDTGVIRTAISAGRWTHCAVPKGMDDGTDTDTADKPTCQPTLRRGSQGDAVVTLQLALRDRGFDMEPDGIFGAITLECVKTFQAARGLSADGIVGPKTWAALDQASSDSTAADTYTVTIFGVDAATAAYFLETYKGATAVKTG